MQGLFNKTITPKAQEVKDPAEIKHAPKIFTDTCRIDFTKTAREVHNLVRGLSPYPGAFTMLNGKTLKIYSGNVVIDSHTRKPGDVVSDNKTFLRFACSDGYYEVMELQLEGKKRMKAERFSPWKSYSVRNKRSTA
ncbi:MAG: hypothetical protein NVV59_17465 [Chitinophagaceae bacterium]|nr:hypothetical protein [Chitinophagaceae bacterium]